MKKLISAIIIVLIVVIFVLTGDFKSTSASLATKADDLSIEPGITRLQDLIDGGFTYEWDKLYEPMKTIKEKTYTPSYIILKKNNEEYAKVGLINKSGSPAKLDECIIGDTNIYTNNKDCHKFNEITVNNENIVGLKLDDLKAKFKEKPTSEDDKKVSYVYDKYGYTFEFDEQKNITKVNFDIMETKIKY